MNTNSIKDLVLVMLSRCRACRDDDAHLIGHIIKNFPEISQNKGNYMETIRRTRQHIQNDLVIFPPSQEVFIARKEKQARIEKFGV